MDKQNLYSKKLNAGKRLMVFEDRIDGFISSALKEVADKMKEDKGGKT